MSKSHKVYACQLCGMTYAKWKGKCDSCQAWNTLEEELLESNRPKSAFQVQDTEKVKLFNLSDKPAATSTNRLCSHIKEFDRVVGNGLVPGSLVLIGGEPGIGKSTLLLQLVADLSHQATCGYFSGEEGVEQIQQRAERLSITSSNVKVTSVCQLEVVIDLVNKTPELKILVIDSIQTLYTKALHSAPGTVAQIRQCTSDLMRLAKSKNVSIILVGHVTKDGNIAGPRLLEHMVDTVLYFEGDRSHTFRLLRSIKNRFGPTHELGIFQMTGSGLESVDNPSQLFLPERNTAISGAAIFAGLEGTRPLLVEIEALVARTSSPNPRRSVVGWDQGRLSMILAVLEARCGLNLTTKDIYLNVVGGLKLSDTAADFAVAMALASAAYQKPLNMESVFLGEVALSGELRPVKNASMRCNEAIRLGFPNIFGSIKTIKLAKNTYSLKNFKHLKEAFSFFFSGEKTAV